MNVRELFALDTTDPSKVVWLNHPKDSSKNGTAALTSTHDCGYKYGKLANKSVYAHRVVFELYYGYPPLKVDHIDGDPANNHPSNLRSVTHAQNMRNTPKARGFRWHDGAFQVEIRTNGKQRVVGRFKCMLDARATYLAAKRVEHPEAAIGEWV